MTRDTAREAARETVRDGQRLDEPRLIAALTFGELRRHAGAWRLPAVSSILFALVFVGFATTTDAVRERATSTAYLVGAEGDVASGVGVLEHLEDRRFTLGRLEDGAIPIREDVAADVRKKEAALGLRFPPGLDERIAAGEEVTVEIVGRRQHNGSVESVGLAVLALDELARQAADDQATDDQAAGDHAAGDHAAGDHAAGGRGRALTVDVREIDDQPELNRLGFGQRTAALAALLCLGVVTSVASVLGSAADQRALEVLLLLPVRRRSITTGTVLGALPMVLLQVSLGLVVLLAVALVPLPTLGQSAGAVASMIPPALAGAAMLGVLAAALGVLAGALGGGSADAVSLGDLLVTPFLALGVLLLLVPDISVGPLSASVPLLGPLLVVREGVAGTLGWSTLVLAVVSSALTTAVLLGLASRRLPDERRILRSIR